MKCLSAWRECFVESLPYFFLLESFYRHALVLTGRCCLLEYLNDLLHVLRVISYPGRESKGVSGSFVAAGRTLTRAAEEYQWLRFDDSLIMHQSPIYLAHCTFSYI